MTSNTNTNTTPPTYEDLALLERTLSQIDTAILGATTLLTAPHYTKRAALSSRIPHFWPLVLEHAPPEIDQFVQPSDSAVFAACLAGIEVVRFEMPQTANLADLQLAATASPAATTTTATNPFGEPRSFELRFTFHENEWFDDRVLTKRFWHRRARDGWTGKVSEPVPIRWKSAERDLTDGLTDAAVAFYDAQKAAGLDTFTPSEATSTADDAEAKKALAVERKAYEQRVKSLPAYTALSKKIDAATEGSQSFFTFFGYRGRWLSAAESSAAEAAETARLRSAGTNGASSSANGEKEDDGDGDDDTTEDLLAPDLESDTDIFPAGEELAVALADDVFPNAIQYFTAAQEDVDGDVEGMFSSDEDDEEVDEEEEEEGDGKATKKRKLGA